MGPAARPPDLMHRTGRRSFDRRPVLRAAGRYIPMEMMMNNAELAETIAGPHGLSKADARKLVDDVFTAIADAAGKGDEVSLSGFGKFKVKESAAREGRNPSTGATIQIAASNKLTFTPAKAVKDRLNG
jgi:DNA-binding protein HU-beta